MNIQSSIIYEDQDMIICHKQPGWLSQSDKSFAVDMVSALRAYRVQKKEDSYIGIINRLDRPVSGLVLFAKTPQAAGNLTRKMQQNHINKYYYAVVCGKLPEKTGTLVDYLVKDGKTNTSRVITNTKEGKRAELEYEVLKEIDGLSLVRIHLKTGRHHQIRVQFASRGLPLLGDSKYNPQAGEHCNIALCAYRLELLNRVFEVKPCGPEFSGFFE